MVIRILQLYMLKRKVNRTSSQLDAACEEKFLADMAVSHARQPTAAQLMRQATAEKEYQHARVDHTAALFELEDLRRQM